jgi:hypothetical protein
VSLADAAALCHAPKLEQEQQRRKHGLPSWFADCVAPCPPTVPVSEFDGPRRFKEPVSRYAELPWVVVAENLRAMGATVIERLKKDLPKISFTNAKFLRDSAVNTVSMIWFDYDKESQVANAPAFWWAYEIATFYYETSSSGVVTEQNPLGLPRARIGIPLANHAPRDKFKDNVARIAQFISDCTGLRIDCTASLNLFWNTGPRPSEAAPPRRVDWTPGYSLDFDKVIEHLDKHLPPAPVVAPEPKPRRTPAGRYNPQAFRDTALLQMGEAIANSPIGIRNKETYRQVRSQAQLINQGQSETEIIRVARAACVANGSYKEDPKACERTIKSAIKAGLRQPRLSTVTVVFDVVAVREQALSRALAHSLKPRERQVTEVIVSALDVVTGYSTITHETIAQRLGITVRSVIRIIERLEGRVVVVTRTKIPHPDKPGSTRNAPNQYRIV